MKDPTKDNILNLLPELYPSQKNLMAPAGLCTPENGCGPGAKRVQADILAALTGSNSKPPEQTGFNDSTSASDPQPDITDLLFLNRPKS